MTRLLIIVAVLLSVLAFRSPLVAGDPKEQHKEHAQDLKDKKHDSRDAAHEPSAMEHVLDDKTGHWHLFDSIWPHSIHLPKVFGFQITKFMVLEVIAALLVIAIYIPVAQRLRHGEVPTGTGTNFFEVLLTFIRDQVAKPAIGEHDADRYVPFLWTMFLFILFNNLLGMVPFGGSPTASIFVTAALALIVFFVLHGSAIAKMGFAHYLQSMWPNIDVPYGLGYLLKPMIFVIELIGLLVRNAVLAVRLFANMFAGHMVLATLLIFIFAARHAIPLMWATISVTSVLGQVALSLLELFVAFLQAYIFVFLTALFMGMALHPQH